MLSRGWVCSFGNVTVRHRLRFDYNGDKGSACRLPPDHPPWLVSGLPDGRKWFYSLEEALAWAQGEISMQRVRGLG